jgi:lysophospholipase L1-like esterase
MKPNWLIVAALLTAATSIAQTAPAVSPSQNNGTTAVPAALAAKPVQPPRLTEPVRSTVPDVTHYLNLPGLLAFCTTQVAEFNNRDADIIFVGDSITQGWRGAGKEVWDTEFAPRNALDFGVSSDQTQHVLWRLDNYPIGRMHPKVAVILIGTNNTHNTPGQIAAGIQAVIDRLQMLFPGIKTILNSIMPNARANDLMMKANDIIRTYADQKKIFYLDLVPLMTPVGDNYKGLGPDRLHPDAAGYRLWADALLPLLNKLLPPEAAIPGQ